MRQRVQSEGKRMNRLSGDGKKKRERERERTGEGVEFELNGHEGGGSKRQRFFFLSG